MLHADPTDAAAESSYREALALAEEIELRPLIARCHLGLGRLYARTGAREQADQHLTVAASMLDDMGMGYWLEQARAEIKQWA